jgi:hypothetical protein
MQSRGEKDLPPTLQCFKARGRICPPPAVNRGSLNFTYFALAGFPLLPQVPFFSLGLSPAQPPSVAHRVPLRQDASVARASARALPRRSP